MTFDLDNIHRMWEEDAKIDPDNLHTESLNIPALHSKYLRFIIPYFFSERKRSNRKEIYVTKDTNIILGNLIQKYM